MPSSQFQIRIRLFGIDHDIYKRRNDKRGLFRINNLSMKVHPDISGRKSGGECYFVFRWLIYLSIFSQVVAFTKTCELKATRTQRPQHTIYRWRADKFTLRIHD